MLKIYIDKEPEWIDIDMLNDCDCYNDFVLTGNRDYMDIHTDCEWYKHTTDVLSDIDSDNYAGESLRSYGDIDRAQRKALVKLYNECRSIDDLETVAAAANILYPSRHFETATIRGYCQGDWQECVYDAAEKDYLKYVEAYYFSMVAELHIKDDDGDTCYDIIPDFELWDYERADIVKQELLNRFGYPIDTPCKLYESDGYTRVKNWKTA